MIEFLNQNPVVTALLSALIAGVIAAWVCSKKMKAMQIQLSEYRRAQKHQQHALLERIIQASDMSRENISSNMTSMFQMMETTTKATEERLERLSQSLENRQNAMQRSLDDRVRELQEANDKRIGTTFQQVSEQLERVHKGLGEMQNLAQGVGDLKKVLTGVKTRGIWGELRLQTLLEENLAPNQYAANTTVAPNETERVEFAVKLPGREADAQVLLPIDSKFPQEDYQRLLEAQEEGNKEKIRRAESALDQCVMTEGKRISDKYIRIPYTTDFAVMFLPIEGLYAEVLRRPELSEKLQKKYRVVITGPTTLTALLNSLQMGFRSVAVEKRSEEIWRLLGSVRDEFAKYGEAIDRTRQRLEQATGELDTASARTRAIHRRLKMAEELEPEQEEPPRLY